MTPEQHEQINERLKRRVSRLANIAASRETNAEKIKASSDLRVAKDKLRQHNLDYVKLVTPNRAFDQAFHKVFGA